jgi:hypothetical protein
MQPFAEGSKDSPDSLGAEPVDFWYLLHKEVERSRRYYRSFGLVRVDASGPSAGGGSVPGDWLELVPQLLRRADLVAPAANGVLYVLLPETPASCLPVIARRVREALQTRSSAAAHAMPRVWHAAFPRDGDTGVELLGSLQHAPA